MTRGADGEGAAAMGGRAFSLAVKRVLDVVGAGAGLVVLAPLLATLAVALRVTQGAPVLYRQTRPGLGGRPFTIVKFRTMRPNDEAAAETFRTFLDSPHRVVIEFTPDYSLSFDGVVMWERSPQVKTPLTKGGS